MGRVYLDVIAERVPYATWERIYERARRVAKQWQPRPLALGWRQIGGVRVAQYVLDIETEYGLSIIEDAETRTTGESFTSHRGSAALPRGVSLEARWALLTTCSSPSLVSTSSRKRNSHA